MKSVLRRQISTAWVLGAMLFGLGACGGGGSSSSQGGGTTPPPNTPPPAGSNVPQNPPALPTVPYGGKAGPADLNDENAGALADALWIGMQLAIALADSVVSGPELPADTIDETFAGPEGGTLRITGRSVTDQTGWLLYEYDNFRDGGITYDGREVLERLQSSDRGEVNRIAIHNLRISDAFVDFNYAGHVTLDRSYDLYEVWGIQGSFAVRDNPTSVELYVANADISYRQLEEGWELKGAGRVHDSRNGWVDLSFEEPWAIRANETFPHHGGAMLGTGSGGRVLRVASLTPEIVSLQYATTGSDVNRSARLSWLSSFEAQTHDIRVLEAPTADAGSIYTVQPGTKLQLSGAFSSHPQSAFIEHRWSFQFRPPGSVADIDGADRVHPEITLDKPGRYLLRLKVDDGDQGDHDFVLLTASEDVEAGLPVTAAQLGPDRSAAVGDVIQIDKRLFTPVSYSDQMFKVSGYAPDGQELQFSQDDSTASFTPTDRGIYQIELHENFGINGTLRDLQSIAVDVPVAHAAPVWFPVEGTIYDIATADLDGDGRSEVIASTESNDRVGMLDIYYAESAGLKPAVRLQAGVGGKIAVGDLTGDGLLDIATVAETGIDLLVQNSDTSFRQAVRLPAGGYFFTPQETSLVVADINGDGLTDIAGASWAPGNVYYYLQQEIGELAGPFAIDFGVTERFNLTAGDLNGDGIDDIVISMESPQPKNIAVLYGQRNNELSAPVYLPHEATDTRVPGLAIGDINGDLRQDLVFSEDPFSDWLAASIHVYQQTAVGGLAEIQTLDTADRVFGLLLHDFDRDGRTDIASRDSRIGLGVHYQQEDGAFGGSVRDLRTLTSFYPMQPYSIGDINGDGLSDVIFRDRMGRSSVVGILFGAEP